jgi:sugar lactone lactonase YvrE
MKLKISALAALAATSVAPVGAGPITQDACAGLVSRTKFAQVGNDVLENLLFTAEGLWVSDSTAGAILRFAPNGTHVVALPGISSPGGLVKHPAQAFVYAGQGNSIQNALTRSGTAKILRFDPAAPASTLETYATGFNMVNGMTTLPNGDLVISNDFDNALIRVPLGSPQSWSSLADAWGANGLVVDPAGANLYAAITFDQRSPIERIRLSSGTSETAVQLTVGVASLEPGVHTAPDTSRPLIGLKGLDDMTGTADGKLYPVANGMGELLEVDPNTGAACLVASGLQNPSSVRIAPEGSGFADGDPATLDFYVTQFSGSIDIVRYRKLG